MTVSTQHHHHSTTKTDHKPFKGRHASNRQLKAQAKGKVEDRGRRRTPYQQTMSKLARKNQAKQLRRGLRDHQDRESVIFQGSDGAPKHVAVVPLTPAVDVAAAISRLSHSVDAVPSDLHANTVRIDRFRRSLRFLAAPFDLVGAVDVCKLADWVVFVLAAHQTYDDQVDTLLRAIEGQGMTSFAAVVEKVDSAVPSAKRSRHLVDLKSGLGHYLPSLDKLASLDSQADCANLVRSLCTAASKGIRWRDDRSWMLIEDIGRPEASAAHLASDASATATVTVSGIVRGRPLNPDRLVHVQGWGEFRVAGVRQILTQSHKRKADEMAVEQTAAEWGPTAEQDGLDELAPETVDMTDVASTAAPSEHKGVLLDDHHYFSDDDADIAPRPKKLPKGTSAYQAAWYLDDVSDSDSDADAQDGDGDLNMQTDDRPRPEDGFVARGDADQTEVGASEYPESEAPHVDADADEEARQLQDFRASRKREAEDDLEFPDEIELHPESSARERLAKYRGLKSLRTSEWNTAEDAPYEPEEHKRLLQIPDYKRSSNAAKKEALAGPIPAGTRVEIHLSQVPLSVVATAPAPSALFSLLRHEHKHAVVNLNLTLRSDVEAPVKSKEELVVQIGHRRLLINPIFSAPGQTPNDVHKFDRFLHPGRTAIASFQGPITWGSTPVLVFKRQLVSDDAQVPNLVDADAMQDVPNSSSSCSKSVLKLIGSATTMPSSSSRVIAKRAILTGHPYKIHKKLVTVRYMFFNREDVNWFAALPLWTKRGRQGFIKEPLGTHGYFKATFDGRINPLDAIGVSLYKRVWPRPARRHD